MVIYKSPLLGERDGLLVWTIWKILEGCTSNEPPRTENNNNNNERIVGLETMELFLGSNIKLKDDNKII